VNQNQNKKSAGSLFVCNKVQIDCGKYVKIIKHYNAF
jgi:hypothetical protein